MFENNPIRKVRKRKIYAMAKKRTKSEAPSGAGHGGNVPPVETRWKPGQSGNPAGRKTAGAYLREELNSLVLSNPTAEEVRRIARDPKEAMNRRAAAERYLRLVESGDLADFEPWLNGEKTLEQLRAEGLNTEIVKKSKITDKGSRELELHDRAGTDFDRITDQTAGKATQPIEVTEKLLIVNDLL
jgi:hypothetical protein